MKLKKFVKDFCVQNKGKESIDFAQFMNANLIFKKYGDNLTFNAFKGRVFELLLDELFTGNGFLVENIGEFGNDGGCDLIIRYPKDQSIRFILQAKNWNNPISTKIIAGEYDQFRRNYKSEYSLSDNNYCFVAWKYVKGVKVKINEELGINAWDEEDIIKVLFANYQVNKPKRPNIILEPFQKNAFGKILKYWSASQPCYVEHSTGTGKTYIIAKLVEYLNNFDSKILILSPSDFINRKIRDLLRTYIPINQISLKFDQSKFVNISTYQFVYHNSTLLTKAHFTHLILDEAHRAGAPEWHSKGVLPLVSRDIKIVGLSATMERYVAGINVKDFLGNNCAGELSLFKAMARGILPKIGKYVFAAIDTTKPISELKKSVNVKYKNHPSTRQKLLKQLNVKEVTDYSLTKVIIKHYQKFEHKKILVFCEDYRHTNDIQRILDNSFSTFCKSFELERITSRNKKSRNHKTLNEFSNSTPMKKQIKILLAIDMLNEGIDIRGIDSIMLFRKTSSPRIYFQQIGRVLRRHGHSDPLIFDCVLNFSNINIDVFGEYYSEVKNYNDTKRKYGFPYTENQKAINIIDEVKAISTIIKDVEKKLDYYESYLDAMNAVRNLGIKSESEYRRRYQEDNRLPSKPYLRFNNKGWIDWYHFLGTNAPNFYKTYEQAKEAALSLKIKSSHDYRKRYREDEYLPSQPNVIYEKLGWKNWNNFLGKYEDNKYGTYEEASAAAKKLKITSYTEYKKMFMEDPLLPSKPQIKYKDIGWIDYPTFLEVSNTLNYQTYDEAREAAKKIGIKNENQYREFHSKDPRLPSNPNRYYKNKGWLGWYDFFYRKKNENYANYKEAATEAHKLKCHNIKEYRHRCKQNPMLPLSPEKVYKNKGWKNYYEYLGIKPPTIKYGTLKKAKQACESLGIKSRKEYIVMKRYKEDLQLPSDPSKYYKGKGWTNWNNFLMTFYKDIESAKVAVKRIGIKSRKDYLELKYYKADKYLPGNPAITYKNCGWMGWNDFLGNKKPVLKYQTYEEAKSAVKKLKINSIKNYTASHHLDERLPCSPSQFYANRGWVSFLDFFGKTKSSYYKSLSEASESVQKLKITSITEYRKKYVKDSKLHSSPDKFYENNGWD